MIDRRLSTDAVGRVAAVISIAIVVTSCASRASVRTATDAPRSMPGKARVASTSTYKRFEYALPDKNCGPAAIALGPDHAFWFTEARNCRRIGRVDLAGNIREFGVGDLDMRTPWAIVMGQDHALWFAAGNRIGRITASGLVTSVSIPIAGFEVTDLTVTMGTLWYCGFSGPSGAVGRVETGMTATVQRTPGRAWHIASDSDGSVWYTQDAPPAIWQIAPGQSSTHIALDASPIDVVATDDRSVWVLERLPDVGENALDFVERTESSGKTKRIDIEAREFEPDYVALPSWIARGPGGLWIGTGSLIGKVTVDGTAVYYSPKSPKSMPSKIAVDPDGSLWFAEPNIGAIGRIEILDKK
jgi:streptogramin lyase